MSRQRLDRYAVEAAVLGGAVLGGGGGGYISEGRRIGLLAVEMGEPELVGVEDLPDEAVLVTASAVGAPAASTARTVPLHYVKALELLAEETKVDGVVTNECGGFATVNGWLQAAVLGIPVVDAPCNGRAHPTGVMGSMGLHRVSGYVSRQAVVGGDVGTGGYLELVVRGSLEKASALVRQASTHAGGIVAVARNPVSVSYAREHAAAGAIGQALTLGRAMLEAQAHGPVWMVEAACQMLRGEILGKGRVSDVRLRTEGGFDVGQVTVERADGSVLDLAFWNEYATCECLGKRLATFPDLLATLDLSSGVPLSSAEIAPGKEVAVLKVPHEHLILGAGMRDMDLMRPLERAIGKEIVSFLPGSSACNRS